MNASVNMPDDESSPGSQYRKIDEGKLCERSPAGYLTSRFPSRNTAKGEVGRGLHEHKLLQKPRGALRAPRIILGNSFVVLHHPDLPPPLFRSEREGDGGEFGCNHDSLICPMSSMVRKASKRAPTLVKHARALARASKALLLFPRCFSRSPISK